jgi:hypothetical protein
MGVSGNRVRAAVVGFVRVLRGGDFESQVVIAEFFWWQGTEVARDLLRVQLAWLRGMSARPEEADVGRRGRRKEPQGRAQNRAQSRVRERVRGGAGRDKGGSTARKRGGFDVGAVEDLAGRLANRPGGGSGLAGAAAGLAGGGLAGRFLGGGTEGSEEDLRGEVADQFALVEERLQLLEDQMQELREMHGGAEPPTGPEAGTDAGGNP